MGDSSQPYFVPLIVRKIVLRIIIISGLATFAINMRFGILAFSPPTNDDQCFLGSVLLVFCIVIASALLHHILRLRQRKIWSVRSELIYSTVEFIIVTGCFITETVVLSTIEERSWSWVNQLLLPALVPLWLSISASFIFMFWDLYVSKHLKMKSLYNFTGKYDDMITGGRKSKTSRWSLLLGEKLFRKRFRTDRVLVRGLRAVMSILCVLGMIVFGYLVLVFRPSNENSSLETVTGGSYAGYDGNVTMQVVSVLSYSADDNLDVDIAWWPESEHVQCRPHADQDTSTRLICNVPSPFSEYAPETFVITINYTRVLSFVEHSTWLRTGVYLDLKAGAREDMEMIVDSSAAVSPPIQLYPGFHVFGTTLYSFRESYASTRDQALGIPLRDRRVVMNLQSLLPDPAFISSNSDNVTATLRLTYPNSLAAQYDFLIQREQANSSVLSGFALLGGIWTFINGLFATVFGCSLLLVAFGIKPLSVYGLVHLFQRQRPLVGGRRTLSAEEQSQTIAVLREHLLDDDYGDTESIEAGEGASETMMSEDGGISTSAEQQSRTSGMSREPLLGENSSDMEAGKLSEEK